MIHPLDRTRKPKHLGEWRVGGGERGRRRRSHSSSSPRPAYLGDLPIPMYELTVTARSILALSFAADRQLYDVQSELTCTELRSQWTKPRLRFLVYLSLNLPPNTGSFV